MHSIKSPTVKLDQNNTSMRYALFQSYGGGSQIDDAGMHEMLLNQKRSGIELPEAVR